MLNKLRCLWAQERLTIVLGTLAVTLFFSVSFFLFTPRPDRNLRNVLIILAVSLPAGFVLGHVIAWDLHRQKLLPKLSDQFLELVNALLHQYEANYKSQEFFESIGCLFEFAHKKRFSSTRELLKFLQDNSAGAVSRLGLRYQVGQHVPFFEQVILERNPALRLHDDIRRSGGAVAFTDFSGDWLQDLVQTIEYHGFHWGTPADLGIAGNDTSHAQRLHFG